MASPIAGGLLSPHWLVRRGPALSSADILTRRMAPRIPASSSWRVQLGKRERTRSECGMPIALLGKAARTSVGNPDLDLSQPGDAELVAPTLDPLRAYFCCHLSHVVRRRGFVNAAECELGYTVRPRRRPSVAMAL